MAKQSTGTVYRTTEDRTPFSGSVNVETMKNDLLNMRKNLAACKRAE